ncbi:reverse transcriptase [Pyrenophora tritici-repentis]|nr:reverse transcriptase [Pyrenophora tritici-repentis]
MGTQRVQEKVLFLAAVENVDVLMLQDIVANTSQPIETQKTTPSNKSGTSARRAARKNTFKPAVASPGFRLVLEHAFSHRVCIYVRHDLDVSAYELVQHDDMITTFSLLTDVDWLHMHCIYNVTSKSIPTDRFKELMSGPGQHLMMGDFNMKHPWWGGRRVRNQKSKESKALHEAFRYELELCLLSEAWSTLDLAFATSTLAKRCTTKTLPEYVGSYHYITQVDIEMSPNRVFSERRDYNSANGAQLCKHVKERLKSFEADPLNTTTQLDKSINVLIEVLAEVNGTIPVLPSTQACFTRMSPSVQEAFKAVRRRAKSSNVSQSPAYLSEFRQIERNAKKLWALDKELQWNDHMARLTTNLDGTYKKYRQALRREKTREPAHMPPVNDPKDSNVKHTNVDAKIPDLPFNCDPEDLPTCDQITLNQVDQLIRDIPKVRSIVDGGIPNALLKLCREGIVPYLHRLFNACFRHCYHPAHFKHATTCILRKPSGPYNLPKNWRPIALLCSIGKMFESVICKMLTAIAIKHNMIPETQMAFAGRTTGDALLYAETIIHAAWFKRKMVTLLGLDMSKAYDRVNRTRLLQILHEKSVPKGLIVLIRSFLSDRTTTIRMPGRSSKRRYAVNLGIPQGSPLSPLLFLFYTAPLLEKLAEPRNGKGSRFHVAFSDDLTIMEVSDTAVNNCIRLSADYDICEQWAKDHNMEFNTKKFDCMHFSTVPSEANSRKYPVIPGFVPGDQFGVEFKFLGVMLDPKLNWGPHMAHIQQKKVAPLTRTFKRLFGPKFGPPMEVGTQLYRSVVFSAVTVRTTYTELWGTDVFAVHKGLTRVEAINLVRLKIETVRVAAYMFRICSTTYHPGCPCGALWQTVYHLFTRCPHLSAARRQIIEDTGHNDFYRWLTHDGAIAAKWATNYLGLVVTDWMLHYLSALDPDADPVQLPSEHDADSAAKPTLGRKRRHPQRVSPPLPSSRHHHIERSRAAQARLQRCALQKTPRTHDTPAAHDPRRYLIPVSPLPHNIAERLTDCDTTDCGTAECLTRSASSSRPCAAYASLSRNPPAPPRIPPYVLPVPFPVPSAGPASYAVLRRSCAAATETTRWSPSACLNQSVHNTTTPSPSPLRTLVLDDLQAYPKQFHSFDVADSSSRSDFDSLLGFFPHAGIDFVFPNASGGLVPFCVENPQLRVERRNVAEWICETKYLRAMGMLPDSFSLVLHGPSKEASQQLCDAMIRVAIWHDGAEELARREGEELQCWRDGIAEDFVDLMKSMIRGDVPARFGADMGEVWNIEEILRDHQGEWPASVSQVFALSNFEEPDGGWEAARAGYFEEVEWLDRMEGWNLMVAENQPDDSDA